VEFNASLISLRSKEFSLPNCEVLFPHYDTCLMLTLYGSQHSIAGLLSTKRQLRLFAVPTFRLQMDSRSSPSLSMVAILRIRPSDLVEGIGHVLEQVEGANDSKRCQLYEKKSPEEYWPAIIPDYPMHCKRVAYDAGWLEALNLPNVHLTSTPIASLDETGLTTSDGKHYEFDYICWATGFEVAETGVGLNHGVKGEDGRELRQIWKEKDGGYGYLGVAAPKIPNYAIVLGPNSIAMSWGYTLGHNVSVSSLLAQN